MSKAVGEREPSVVLVGSGLVCIALPHTVQRVFVCAVLAVARGPWRAKSLCMAGGVRTVSRIRFRAELLRLSFTGRPRRTRPRGSAVYALLCCRRVSPHRPAHSVSGIADCYCTVPLFPLFLFFYVTHLTERCVQDHQHKGSAYPVRCRVRADCTRRVTALHFDASLARTSKPRRAPRARVALLRALSACTLESSEE